jgi:5-hydroxyisourate hydrolase-like protein (transthyretin family)
VGPGDVAEHLPGRRCPAPCPGATRRWSATHAAPYFTYTSGGVAHTVWYNDAASTAAKMRLVEKYGIRGMAFWHVAGEDARQWSQIRAYATPSRASLTSSTASAVVYGGRATVSGVLRNASGKALPQVAVRLQRRKVGTTAWTTVATGRTTASGTVSLTHQPTVSSQVRLVSASGWAYTAASSPVRRTLVRWKATAAFNASSIPNLTTVVLRGTVSPAVNGTLVRRQLKVDGVWTTLQEARTRADGTYAFSWRMSAKKGSYAYRVRVPAAAGKALGTSPTRILTVR